jgi:hypothetical protein
MQPGYPSPYAPPGFQPAPIEGARPGVVLWAKLYAAAFALMYLACTVGGVLLVVVGSGAGVHDAEKAMIQGWVMAVLGPILLVLSIIALAAPRKKWGWVVNIVLIGLGCTSCMCLPASIPLMTFWLKPETRRWYSA